MGGITDVSFNQMEGKDIVIHPISRDSVTPVGYDLRAGLIGVLAQGESETRKDPEGKLVYVIPANTSVYIRTKEYVWLSKNVIATVHARGSLAAKGLFLNSTTVDPNWRGQMTCLIHNINKHDIEITSDMAFATMVMSTADQPTQRGPETNPQRVTDMYLERYGREFSEIVAAYRSSDEQSRLSNEFNDMVAKARELSVRGKIRESLRDLINKVREFVDDKARSFGFAFVLICVVALMIIAAFPSLLMKLGVVDSSANVTLVSSLALFVSVLAILQRLVSR